MEATSGAIGMDSSALLSTLTPFVLSSLLPSDPVEMLHDPIVEAEVLTGFSHVAIDFAGFMIPGATKYSLRIIVIIGRIFAISGDYVEHHSMYSQNLDINCLMIAIGLADMIKNKTQKDDEQQGNQPPNNS